jgi:Chromo shadow domain
MEEERTEKTGSWTPKSTNWENEIASIDTVERDRETGKLWVFIYFTNGKRSKVGMDKVYKHCPVAMLKFYERHLSVSPDSSEISHHSPSTPEVDECRRDLRRPVEHGS